MESGVTLLVDDISGDYRASVVYLDTHIRQTAPTDDRIHSASLADMGRPLCPVMRQCEADTWHDQSCDLAAAEDIDGVADGRGKVAALVVPGVGLTLAHHRA